MNAVGLNPLTACKNSWVSTRVRGSLLKKKHNIFEEYALLTWTYGHSMSEYTRTPTLHVRKQLQACCLDSWVWEGAACCMMELCMMLAITICSHVSLCERELNVFITHYELMLVSVSVCACVCRSTCRHVFCVADSLVGLDCGLELGEVAEQI